MSEMLNLNPQDSPISNIQPVLPAVDHKQMRAGNSEVVIGQVLSLVNKNNYAVTSLYEECRAMLSNIFGITFKCFSVIHSFNEFILLLTEQDGLTWAYFQKPQDERLYLELVDFCKTSPGFFEEKNLTSGRKLLKLDFTIFLNFWQYFNFKENFVNDVQQNQKLFLQYPRYEQACWESIKTGTPLLIHAKPYTIIKMLGLGKESKAFIARDVNGKEFAIKIGLQILAKEYQHLSRLAQIDRNGLFAKCYDYDPEKNILVMELIHGQEAEKNITSIHENRKSGLLQGELTEQAWLSFLNGICEAIESLSILFYLPETRTAGVHLGGQFNLRNILIDTNGTFRMIDPLFEGTEAVYEVKQMLRILGVLTQKIFELPPHQDFNPYVKQLLDVRALRSLKYPITCTDPLTLQIIEGLDAIQTRDVGIPEPIQAELVRIILKYLSNGIGTYTFKELARDFSGLKHLIQNYSVIKDGYLEHSGDSIFIGRPRAVAIDLNGTLEDGGFVNHRIVKILQHLTSRNFPVAIITGTNIERSQALLIQNNIDPNAIHLFSDEGARWFHHGDLQAMYSIENVLSIKEEIAALKIGVFQCNNCRINIIFDTNKSLSESYKLLFNIIKKYQLNCILSNQGTQADLVCFSVNKALALTRFAAALDLKSDQVVKIGNEPDFNDKELLTDQDGTFLPNAFAVQHVSETVLILERLMNKVGYGAKHETGTFYFYAKDGNDLGEIRDFSWSTPQEQNSILNSARRHADIFYPYFAIKDRLNPKDPKCVDFKWMIYDTQKNPIGICALYELKKEAGVYNIGGMYLIPEIQGKGVGTSVIHALYTTMQAQIATFKGLKVRVSVYNIVSQKMCERAGFQLTNILQKDYTLFVKSPHEQDVPYSRSITKQEREIIGCDCRKILTDTIVYAYGTNDLPISLAQLKWIGFLESDETVKKHYDWYQKQRL